MPRVRSTDSSIEPRTITVISVTQQSQHDCPSAAGELTTANADIDFPSKKNK